MNEIDDGGTAFPQAQRVFDNDTQSWIVCSVGGASLRDYFAAAALTGLIAKDSQGIYPWGGEGAKFATKEAYVVADAMLAARKEGA